MRETQSGAGTWGQILDKHVGFSEKFHENCMVLFFFEV
jgi:hypothetical protein